MTEFCRETRLAEQKGGCFGSPPFQERRIRVKKKGFFKTLKQYKVAYAYIAHFISYLPFSGFFPWWPVLCSVFSAGTEWVPCIFWAEQLYQPVSGSPVLESSGKYIVYRDYRPYSHPAGRTGAGLHTEFQAGEGTEYFQDHLLYAYGNQRCGYHHHFSKSVRL